MRPGASGELARPDPSVSADTCPFCAGRESETPPELHAHAPDERRPDTAGWRTRLVPNKFPVFGAEAAMWRSAPLLSEAASGAQDVLIHAPTHQLSLADLSPRQLGDIVSAWRWRATCGRPHECLYTHLVVNEGPGAGASLDHTHSQLFSLPRIPPRVAAELEIQANASDCLVCDVLSAERASARAIVEQDGLLAYCPHASRFPYEWVVAPLDCEADAFSSERLGSALRLAVATVRALRAHVGWAPINLWLTTSPHIGMQTHWRLTVAPRLTTPAGLELGAGIAVNSVDPDAAAGVLRALLD